jgi:preprotein translocase subunit SecD
VLDNQVITAPRIRAQIQTNGVIEGNFTPQSAQDLALLLRAGALPADVTVIEQRTVGASLGADSIRAGEIAAVIAMVAVVLFMVLYYGLFGLFANLALFINMAMIAGALSLLQATLTLPGIAGIVLTIGMAVDANVLIFERIREEADLGRTPISAIDAGYQRAMTTIVDANLTTLIAALLLFQFGTGPIKGFAVTLAIGVLTSMFTAIMLTRLMVVTWLRRRRPQSVPL